MNPTQYRIGSAYYMPFAADLTASIEAQLLRVDTIFAVIDADGIDHAWIDGIDEEDPVLIPVRSLEGYREIGDFETYLCEEFHTQLGAELPALLELAVSEALSATVLVRALAILHNEQAATAVEAVQMSFQFGLAFLRAASLERYSYGLEQVDALVAELAAQNAGSAQTA